MNTAATPTADAASALVPLADCYLHPLNTRSEPPSADIDALAGSIDACGLLQNLAGWIDPNRPDEIGIVAGGRRLRALLQLAAIDGRDLSDTRVPVRIAPDQDTARTWASAENAARSPLHPADEVRAYNRMAKQGSDPNAIARAFAVTERHVRQRLRLANLPATALAALRDGQISLDQAAALTIATSSDAAEAQLTKVLTSSQSVPASEIRRLLTQGGVSPQDSRVTLVGIDAYRAAGGALNEDLFTDHVELLDEALLDELVAARMAKAVEAHKAVGWKWVEVISDLSTRFDHSQGMEYIHRVAVDLPDADQTELEELSDFGRDLTDTERERLIELETRAEGDFDPEDIATSGIWLYLGYDGEIETHGPFRARDDTPGDSADAENGDAPTGADAKAETRTIPNNLREDLDKIRTAALQIRAAKQTELMLDLLAFQLSALRTYHRAFDISTSTVNLTLDKADGFEPPALIIDEPDGTAEVTPEAFDAFRALGKKHRNEALTRALARLLLPYNDLIPVLAAQLAPSPREIWTPTKTGYFARLPSGRLDDIWGQLVPEDRANVAEFTAMKKADKAAQLHRLFNDADYREALGLDRETNQRIDAWMPEQLFWPEPEGEG